MLYKYEKENVLTVIIEWKMDVTFYSIVHCKNGFMQICFIERQLYLMVLFLKW